MPSKTRRANRQKRMSQGKGGRMLSPWKTLETQQQPPLNKVRIHFCLLESRSEELNASAETTIRCTYWREPNHDLSRQACGANMSIRTVRRGNPASARSSSPGLV